MSELNYKYAPPVPEEFKCRVPLPDTVQAFVVNGSLREGYDPPEGCVLEPSGDKGYSYFAGKGADPEHGMQIISFRDSSDTGDIFFESNYFFEENSRSSLLLCTHTLSIDHFNTEEIVNINIQKNAEAKIVVMQNEHNNSAHKVNFRINVAEGGYLRITVVTLHGSSLENSFDVKLNGSKANCELNGVYLVDGEQVVDTKVYMHHLVPDCLSSQLFKGILDDKSRASFTGRIVVAKDAQKTEAYQANHNLLLSRTAKAYAKPQLEIYADDVKCSHGATSGRLDETALFYMRSRGIGKVEARLLQQLAFVYDVLEEIDNEKLRKRLYDLVESRLRGEFGNCENCSMNCC